MRNWGASMRCGWGRKHDDIGHFSAFRRITIDAWTGNPSTLQVSADP